MVNWQEEDLKRIFGAAGASTVEIGLDTATSQLTITPEQLERWFASPASGQRPTFGQHLLTPSAGEGLAANEIADIERLFIQQISGQIVSWQSITAYIVAARE
jgi:hypothetical protein